MKDKMKKNRTDDKEGKKRRIERRITEKEEFQEEDIYEIECSSRLGI